MELTVLVVDRENRVDRDVKTVHGLVVLAADPMGGVVVDLRVAEAAEQGVTRAMLEVMDLQGSQVTMVLRGGMEPHPGRVIGILLPNMMEVLDLMESWVLWGVEVYLLVKCFSRDM